MARVLVSTEILWYLLFKNPKGNSKLGNRNVYLMEQRRISPTLKRKEFMSVPPHLYKYGLIFNQTSAITKKTLTRNREDGENAEQLFQYPMLTSLDEL